MGLPTTATLTTAKVQDMPFAIAIANNQALFLEAESYFSRETCSRSRFSIGKAIDGLNRFPILGHGYVTSGDDLIVIRHSDLGTGILQELGIRCHHGQ